MNGKYLLDTSIVIALFRGEATILTELSNAEEVSVCSVVLGELYYGARKSARIAQNLAEVDAFAASNTVLACDIDIARQYGIIKDLLRAKGRMIPENDIWIAATAIQHSLPLATRDDHFKEVDGLPIENW